MTILKVKTHLDTLCNSVKASKVQGGFLLSTNDISNYWIPIDAFRTYQTINAVVEILKICLPNFQREANTETVFTPGLTGTTSDTFPLDIIVSIVINQLQDNATITSTKRQPHFYGINVDQYNEVVDIPEGAPSGNWLGIFAMSAHVKLITTVLNELRHRKRTIDYVLILIEREKVTRQRLQQQGIHLVPLVVCDENTGEPTPILEINQPPYINYHKYFIDHA